MNPFQRKAYKPARDASMSPAGAISALFESVSVPVGQWASRVPEERDRLATELVTSGRTAMGDSAIVRRVMDAYAFAYEAARTALS